MNDSQHPPLSSGKYLRVTILRAAATLAAVGAFIAVPAATAQDFSLLYSFGVTANDGEVPVGRLTLDTDGNLYGATTAGGSGGCNGGCGTVFKVDATGVETVLYNFTAKTDGGFPNAGVIRDPAGNLYGTTLEGGNLPACPEVGCGVIYALDPSGNETILHAFQGGTDGLYPDTNLISMQGELYGTTLRGGDATCNCGVIYKVSKSGKYHVLHRFTGSDGKGPQDLVGDSAGNVYGAAQLGGFFNFGSIFKLDTAGVLTILYSFPGGVSGSEPTGRIIRDVNGNFHGTAEFGGDLSCGPANSGCGVVFRLDTAGNQTILHRFGSVSGDGRHGLTGVVDGVVETRAVLFGTTENGGVLEDCDGSGCGTLFSISPSGGYDVILSFTGPFGAILGTTPGPLTLDSSGNLYGVTASGGKFNSGEIFSLSF